MPRVKIDYVVSFSSEDPSHPANNLLELDVSKKKWLCCKGETSCSVVLQLVKAVKISSVNIGAHHAAMVEVLVGRSEKPDDPYEVLVPSSILLSPVESRRESGLDRVRSWSAAQLQGGARGGAREGRWDRVRVVCTQPYNKHCQFGLSFIRIEEPGDAPASAPAPAVPSRLLAVDTFSSDEEEFKPGELFSQRSLTDSQNTGDSEGTPKQPSTESQIRKASSHALRNIPDTSTSLHTSHINKPHGHNNQSVAHTDRTGDRLLYDEDDSRPHTKIDRVVSRHKDDKALADKGGLPPKKDDKKDKLNVTPKIKDKKDVPQASQSNKKYTNSPRDQKHGHNSRKTDSSEKKDTGVKLKAGPISNSPHTLLSGVVMVLSGYVNPERQNIRHLATSLGARVLHAWGPDCTHLICAFSNTPKLKEVRASRGGDRIPVVRGDWVEECSKSRRLLPWQWFATEDKHRLPRGQIDDDVAQSNEPDTDEGNDTDDEIEKVIQKNKQTKDSPTHTKKRPLSPTSSDNNKKQKPNDDINMSGSSDVQFVCDERVKGTLTIDSDSDQTDADELSDTEYTIDKNKCLPSFFDGVTFVVDTQDAALHARCARYIHAYGGLVLHKCLVDEESEVDYVVCNGDGDGQPVNGQVVTTDWLWRCHQSRRMVRP